VAPQRQQSPYAARRETSSSEMTKADRLKERAYSVGFHIKQIGIARHTTKSATSRPLCERRIPPFPGHKLAVSLDTMACRNRCRSLPRRAPVPDDRSHSLTPAARRVFCSGAPKCRGTSSQPPLKMARVPGIRYRAGCVACFTLPWRKMHVCVTRKPPRHRPGLCARHF
jgi:hypothetical protein